MSLYCLVKPAARQWLTLVGLLGTAGVLLGVSVPQIALIAKSEPLMFFVGFAFFGIIFGAIALLMACAYGHWLFKVATGRVVLEAQVDPTDTADETRVD